MQALAKYHEAMPLPLRYAQMWMHESIELLVMESESPPVDPDHKINLALAQNLASQQTQWFLKHFAAAYPSSRTYHHSVINALTQESRADVSKRYPPQISLSTIMELRSRHGL